MEKSKRGRNCLYPNLLEEEQVKQLFMVFWQPHWALAEYEVEWVEMPKTGILHAWTICGFAAKSALKKLPFVLAYVLVGESKTAIANILHIDEPWHTETNMPIVIKMVPKEERVGNLIDFWFEPDPSWKPSEDGKMTEEKVRIKQLCQPVYDWVKILKSI